MGRGLRPGLRRGTKEEILAIRWLCRMLNYTIKLFRLSEIKEAGLGHLNPLGIMRNFSSHLALLPVLIPFKNSTNRKASCLSLGETASLILKRSYWLWTDEAAPRDPKVFQGICNVLCNSHSSYNLWTLPPPSKLLQLELDKPKNQQAMCNR